MADSVSLRLHEWARRFHGGDTEAVAECRRFWGAVVRRTIQRALWRRIPLCPLDETVLAATAQADPDQTESELVESLTALICEALVADGAKLNSQFAERATLRVDAVNTAAIESTEPPVAPPSPF
ncbi:MAG: hypothetical protein D6725_02380 [Planctomycetota bacterium]|nr:MAG: hypothetical protein D6725_02380 [Planctomycetota bacterium]